MKKFNLKTFALGVGIAFACATSSNAFAQELEETDKWIPIGTGQLIDGWFKVNGGKPFDVEIQRHPTINTRYRIWQPYKNYSNGSKYKGQIVFDIQYPNCVLIVFDEYRPSGYINNNVAMGVGPGDELYCVNDYSYANNLMGGSINSEEEALRWIGMLSGQASTYDGKIVHITLPKVTNSDGQILAPTSNGEAQIIMPNTAHTWTVSCAEDAFNFTLNGEPKEATWGDGKYTFEEIDDSDELTATFNDEYSLYKVTSVTASPTGGEVTITESGFTINQTDFADKDFTFTVEIAPVSNTPFITLGEEGFIIEPGESNELSINIANPTQTAFRGFQATVSLPEGIAITKVEKGSALSNTQFSTAPTITDEGKTGDVIVMLYDAATTTGSSLKQGEIMKLTLTANETAKPVTGEVSFSDITFTANNGSDIEVEGTVEAAAEVRVIPTAIQLTSVSMEGIENKTELKATESLTITATLTPAVVTSPKVKWSVNQEDLLDITPNDENEHEVKVVIREGVTAQNVIITATVEETPAVNTSYTFNISDLLLGDANDNGKVNVSDVIAISNEILAQPSEEKSINETFCFINADIDKNNKIEVIDLSATVNIALGEEAFPNKQNLAKAVSANDTDRMLASMTRDNSNMEIAFSLENASAYTTLQADVIIPEGMEVVEVVKGPQAINHTVSSSINSNILRIVSYSLVNDTYADTEEPLFIVKVTVDGETADITMENIIAVDKSMGRHELNYSIKEEETNGINNMETEKLNAFGAAGEIVIMNGEGRHFSIYTVDGKLVNSFVANTNNVRISAACGVYTIVCDSKAFKVIVK